MIVVVILLLAFGLTVGIHSLISLCVDMSLRELYEYYFQNLFLAAYFLFLSGAIFVVFVITFFAINNTYLHYEVRN